MFVYVVTLALPMPLPAEGLTGASVVFLYGVVGNSIADTRVRACAEQDQWQVARITLSSLRCHCHFQEGGLSCESMSFGGVARSCCCMRTLISAGGDESGSSIELPPPPSPHLKFFGLKVDPPSSSRPLRPLI